MDLALVLYFLIISTRRVSACAPSVDHTTTLPPRDPGLPLSSSPPPSVSHLPTAVTIPPPSSSSSIAIPTASSSPSSFSSPVGSTASTVGQLTTEDPQTAFRDNCANRLRGFVNGGRCFFIVNSTRTWSEAWTACDGLGGRLAQILTSAELTVMASYLTTRLGPGGTNETNYIWIALRRNPNIDTSATFLPLNTTFWYDADNTPNPLLSAGNTWLRNRQNNEDVFSPGDDCIRLWSNYMLLGDHPCSARLQPLCEILDTSNIEQFRFINGTCIDETPVEMVSNTISAACPIACRARVWCRSYTFFRGTDCQLFPWVNADQPNSTETGVDCQYYEYIP